ncbi:MAG: hypothetical protein JXQ83_05075 [Candidatus Glassbacteria bacterium]|nr:hypothetical protein [Candidatus Glassbacteria bacterium]
MELNVNWIAPVEHRDYNRMPASIWIRCLQLFPYLEKLGVRSSFNDPASDAPITVIVRTQDEQAYLTAQRLKEAGKRIVFDLCVNYFDECRVPGLGEPVSAGHVEDCLRMVSLADAVACASDNIARRAGRHHQRVEYLPDSIDLNHFRLVKDEKDFSRRRLRAVWCGQITKAGDLEPVLPLIKRKKIALTVISNSKPDLRIQSRLFRTRKFPYCYRPWRYETFPEDILQGEICLTYRETDTTYNLGHSFFKIGVFMAQGVPAIASPVPSYRELMDDRQCGRICRTVEEWEQALDEILADRDMLRQWSSRSREIMNDYSTEKIAGRYLRLFKELI